MLATLITKELRRNFTRYTFMIICLMMVMLIAVGTMTLYRDYRMRVENYELLRSGNGEPVAGVRPSAMSIIAKGLDDMIGRSYRVIFGGQIEVGDTQQSVNPLFEFFTTPDMLFIVKVVMSLAALLISFTLVAGEKESGTLALAMANGVGRPLVILSKWIGSFLIVSVPFVCVFGLAVFVLALLPDVQFMPEDWLRLGLFLLASLVYIGFFVSLGLAASSATQTTPVALVFTLFLWVGIVFVMPSFGNTLARRLVPIPSSESLQREREYVWIKEIFILNNPGRSPSGEAPPANPLQTIHDENDRIMASYRSRLNRLVTLTKRLTMLSPAASFSFFATDIAGTGVDELQRSKQAVLRFRDRVWDRPSDSSGNIGGDFPEFSYRRTPVKEVLSETDGIAALFVLFLSTIAAFAAAYVLFLRYDVRA